MDQAAALDEAAVNGAVADEAIGNRATVDRVTATGTAEQATPDGAFTGYRSRNN